MEGYAAPGTETYTDTSAGNGWYGEGTEAAPVEQQGFSIPTTGQANGGGPMRRGGSGGARFNPMSRGKPSGDSAPVSAAGAEKNELGFIIFAYNIGYQTDENQLSTMFSSYGTVAKVNVIQDFASGQGKGYGFVTMPNAAEAEAAIAALNGSDFNGNTLQIRFKTAKGQNPVGSRGGMKGGFRGGMRGSFRGGQRGAPRGGGFRGGRGGMRGGARGGARGRGGGYGAPATGSYGAGGYGGAYGGGYDAYSGYADPNAGYSYGAEYSDPYAGYSAGTGYASYGATGAQW